MKIVKRLYLQETFISFLLLDVQLEDEKQFFLGFATYTLKLQHAVENKSYWSLLDLISRKYAEVQHNNNT